MILRVASSNCESRLSTSYFWGHRFRVTLWYCSCSQVTGSEAACWFCWDVLGLTVVLRCCIFSVLILWDTAHPSATTSFGNLLSSAAMYRIKRTISLTLFLEMKPFLRYFNVRAGMSFILVSSSDFKYILFAVSNRIRLTSLMSPSSISLAISLATSPFGSPSTWAII